VTETTNDPQPSVEETLVAVAPRPGDGRSRLGQLWFGGVSSALILLLLLIFVLQNGQRVKVSFLGAHGSLPLGVALLLSSVVGVLLVALPGTGRMIQLRLARHRADRAVDGGQAAGR
jgi:uncharacterized integral membrane protein